jgi:hypothetical protein
VRDWICQAWASPEVRERQLREMFGQSSKPPMTAASADDVSNPVKASQTKCKDASSQTDL